MSFFGFGQTADVEIAFDDADKRKVADIKTDDGKKEKYLLYYDGETVAGRVNVTLRKPGAKLEHHGIKVELVGQIELFYDRGNHHEFISLIKELARPGDLLQHTSYPFEFANVEKPYEVYTGSNVRLRYFLRATIIRRLTDIVKEVDIAVHTLCSYPDVLNSIKMEVGIEDCLHIEFEYNKSKYHLKDVIVGKIYFLLVRIKIKHMEISIIKRETTGSGPNTFTENETVAKYEIMDGAPVRGESIPIRVFLAGYDLTPTMRDINNKFSVRYYLNLVLMDTEDRRYFKQQEVTLWRKSDKARLPLSANAHNPTHLVGAPPVQDSGDSSPNVPPRPHSVSPTVSEPSESQNPLAVNNSHDDSDREMTDKSKESKKLETKDEVSKAKKVETNEGEISKVIRIETNDKEISKEKRIETNDKEISKEKRIETNDKEISKEKRIETDEGEISKGKKGETNEGDISKSKKVETNDEEISKKLESVEIKDDNQVVRKPPIAEKPVLIKSEVVEPVQPESIEPSGQ